MRTTAVLALVLFAGLAAPAFGQSFVGEWKATAKAPTGDASEIVTVVKTKDGYSITAKLVDAAPGTPEAGPGTDIVIDGDRFSYKRTVTIGNDSLVITYTGVVSGDTFTGMVELGAFGSIPYVGVRNKH